MKRIFPGMIPMLVIIFGLSGCNSDGEKAASLSVIYASAALLSLLLLIGCLRLIRRNREWFVLLFSSVLVVNIGYTWLSVSSCLEAALWANRVSYLGSVFLPLSMLMIILDATNTPCPKQLPCMLLGAAAAVFLIAGSPGILDLYYKEVSFQVVNGVSTLIKVYGPLHPLYLIYLLSYFSSMAVVIIHAQIRKTIDTTAHAVILLIAVFVNIGVWFMEQITSIEFEMLSVSYIISELFLLGVHLVMNENQRLREIVRQVETVHSYVADEKSESGVMLEKPLQDDGIAPERIDAFMTGIRQLTPTERQVYDAYIARATTKEVLANLGIKESTLKFHNRNLYGKLGVSSRKELLEVHKHIKAVKAKFDESGNAAD